MKWLFRGVVALLAVGALVGAGVGAVFWLLDSESGTAWWLPRVLARVAPTVTIGRIHGSLLSGLVLDDVRLRTPREELDIAELTLTWDPTPALAGTLAFRRAAATTAAYRRSAAAPAAEEPFAELPFPVRVASATIDALTVDVAGNVVTFGATELVAALEGRRLVVEDVATTTGPYALTGDAELALERNVRLDATVRWSGPLASSAAAGSFKLAGTWPTLSVEHELTAPFAATVVGSVELARVPRVDVTVEWRDLEWPGVDDLASPTGRMAIAGTLADYRYDGGGTLTIAGRAASFAGRGRGAREQLAIESLELTPGPGTTGRLTADGNIDVAARIARLGIVATDIDPAWWNPTWPGRLRGGVAVRASLEPATVAFDALDLTGRLRAYPLTLKGAADFAAPNRWTFTKLRLDSAANRVVIDGRLEPAALALTVDADVTNLDLLWPGVRGAVTGAISIGGSLAEPRARGRLVGRALARGEVTLEQLALEGEAGGAAATPLSLKLEATGLARGPLRVARLAADASGTTGAHHVTISMEGDDWQLQAGAAGDFSERSWRGSLEQLGFEEQLLGRWQLVEPAGVELRERQVTIATTCLTHVSGGRWCAAADVRGRAADRLVVVAQNFDLQTLRPLLPSSLALDGVYQLSASLFDPTGEPRGALVLTGEETHLKATLGEPQTYAAEFDDLRAAATLTDGRLELLAAVRGGESEKLDLNAAISDVRARDSAIEGTFSVAWPDVGFLTLLAPELGQLGGNVAGELVVAGTVSAPELTGQATWQGGRVTVPEWGLVVDGIDATAASSGERAVTFDATGHVGDGRLALTGETMLDPQADWPTRLKLGGDAVRAVQLPEAELDVTPNLDVTVTWPDVHVAGTLQVPHASLGLSELPAQAVVPSSDAVVHGRDGARDARRLQLSAGVELVLGDDVHYRGLDLDSKVTGQLHLDTEPNRSANATGTLTLTGTYNAYGQELTLERGQLLFSGPLDDPGLDVRAVRTIDTTTRVGVELAGTRKNPRTRVFSTPAMSEADALSYLLLGRPVAGAGGGENTTLQAAALAMGLNQALPVVQRLGTTLGLDELSVQSTTQDAGALMAGKYLSPKVYIRYSYGLFNRIGGLLLRFKVNERLSLETRSGTQKSMDLLYTVEKD
jgi:translocation and assembly module TamB